MKRNIYLTKRLKDKYSEEFKRVLLCEKEFWKLDPGLKEILTEINSNSYIHTLYSKKPSDNNLQDPRHSYLEICYSYKIETKLFRDVISKMTIDFTRLNDSVFYFYFNWPRPNVNYSKKSEPLGLGCIDDPKYFWINTLHLDLETHIIDIHIEWWEKLKETLARIKP